MKQATAFLDYQLDVDCPHCNKTVDLVEHELNGDRGISHCIFTNNWDALKGWDIECPHCNNDFQLEKVEY